MLWREGRQVHTVSGDLPSLCLEAATGEQSLQERRAAVPVLLCTVPGWLQAEVHF